MELSSINWLLARLRAMPSKEIPHRIAELAKKKYLQLYPTKKMNLSGIDKVGYHFEKEGGTYFDTDFNSQQVALLLSTGPSVFGRIWPCNRPDEINWDLGLDGTNYANSKTFSISYRSTDEWTNDIRQIWELNRLVWLLPVAHQCAIDRNSVLDEYLRKITASFLDSDRPGYSIRWNSAIEIAMQALSLMCVELLLGPKAAELLPKNYINSLFQRLRWLKLLPSRFSSENNHRIAEVVAQLAISARLNRKQKSIQALQQELEKLVLEQFGEDGFNREQSFDYHVFALDLFATLKKLVPDLRLEDYAERRLLKAHQLTSDIYNFCGFWPSANDSDEARLLGILESKDKPPLKLFESSFGATNEMSSSSNTLQLQSAGYVFAKVTSTENELLLLVDYGDLGLPPLHAHAHADFQSIWLWVNKVPTLVESGTFSYHSSPSTRKLLQGSKAHNSISVSDFSIIEPSGPFLWLKKDLPKNTSFEIQAKEDMVGISLKCELPMNHLGQGKLNWIRNINLSQDELVLTDEILGPEIYELSTQLIIGAGLKATSGTHEDLVLSAEPFSLKLSSTGKTKLELQPISTSYGHLDTALIVKSYPDPKSSNKIVSKLDVRRHR